MLTSELILFSYRLWCQLESADLSSGVQDVGYTRPVVQLYENERNTEQLAMR